MAAELISALLDTVTDEGSVASICTVDAVKQTDDPTACLRQTVRFVRMESRRRPSLGNPDLAWMRARCAACGACKVG